MTFRQAAIVFAGLGMMAAVLGLSVATVAPKATATMYFCAIVFTVIAVCSLWAELMGW